MGGGNGGSGGPDLTQGVRAEDVPDRGMLAGHVGEDAVLLAREGDAFFAMGATCTHWGGPLAEGLFENGRVHCPWHHACFDVRTGEAVGAPALNDEPCYTVERRGDLVVVTGRSAEGGGMAAARTEARTPRTSPASVVIVGAGGAGNAAAETLRREGYTGPVTLIDPDEDAPYDRPNLSKDYLAGNAQPEWIPLHPPEFYDDNDIRFIRARVTAIDPGAKRVTIEDGGTHEYDALLLATGAEPVRLNVPVAEGANVHYLRSFADGRALIEAATSARHAVVIGASFIGLEVAASLRARDVAVHVVGREGVPLERVMGRALGERIRAVHEEHGVAFHLGHTASEIGVDSVTLDDGTRIDADLVVIGIGVRPRVQLAEAAGLAMDNGVLVDEQLRTSAPGIWAAGDIARWPDARTGKSIRVEHWVVAERQGQAAARSILGSQEAFSEAPFFWSQHFDTVISYVGHAVPTDKQEIEGDVAADCAVHFLRDGRRVALATIDRDRESLAAQIAMDAEGASAQPAG